MTSIEFLIAKLLFEFYLTLFLQIHLVFLNIVSNHIIIFPPFNIKAVV